MSYHYYNAAGQRFPWPEQPMEPPDCWGKELTESYEEDYDEEEEPWQ